MARRAAAESLAFMGLKVGDGYAVYLIQVRPFFFFGMCLARYGLCEFLLLQTASYNLHRAAKEIDFKFDHLFSDCILPGMGCASFYFTPRHMICAAL